jgi:hypothetical protein
MDGVKQSTVSKKLLKKRQRAVSRSETHDEAPESACQLLASRRKGATKLPRKSVSITVETDADAPTKSRGRVQ